MQFTLCGIPCTISYFFVCSVAIFAAIDRTQLYIPTLLSMLAHEAAHILALVSFRCKIEKVQLLIGAIGVKYSDITLTRLKKLTAIIVGPLCNFLLAIIAFYVGSYKYFGINLVLCVYNLLPVSGLDGGSIVKTLLCGVVSFKCLENILIVLTATTVLVIICISVTCGGLAVNYSILLFCIYLLTPIIIKKLLKDKAV